MGNTKALLFALIVAACASATSPAIAAGRTANRFPLLQCGLYFGGTETTYGEHRRATRQRDAMQQAFARAPGSNASGIFPQLRAKSVSIDQRLPPRFTVARIGCSWH